MDLTVGIAPLARYTNGNVKVTLWPNGSKVRVYEGKPHEEFPECIDLKITDYCDMGCAFCHEGSTVRGRHADVDAMLQTLSSLPAGVELAIGGGNPLDHPDLKQILIEFKRRGWIANLTVHIGHYIKHFGSIHELDEERLFRAIGISVGEVKAEDLEFVRENRLYAQQVLHLIAGVHEIRDLERACDTTFITRVLLLGYKEFGRGVAYCSSEMSNIAHNITEWRRGLFRVQPSWVTLAFDNLAIQQLEPQRLLSKEAWDALYLGEDGTISMYFDAVSQCFASTSRSPHSERAPATVGILNYFSGGTRRSEISESHKSSNAASSPDRTISTY